MPRILQVLGGGIDWRYLYDGDTLVDASHVRDVQGMARLRRQATLLLNLSKKEGDPCKT